MNVAGGVPSGAGSSFGRNSSAARWISGSIGASVPLTWYRLTSRSAIVTTGWIDRYFSVNPMPASYPVNLTSPVRYGLSTVTRIPPQLRRFAAAATRFVGTLALGWPTPLGGRGIRWGENLVG